MLNIENFVNIFSFLVAVLLKMVKYVIIFIFSILFFYFAFNLLILWKISILSLI